MEPLVAHSKDLVIRSTNFNSLTEHRRLAIKQCYSQTYQRWEYTPPGASCGASVSIFVIPMAQILRSVLPDTFCTSSIYNLSITIPNILQVEITDSELSQKHLFIMKRFKQINSYYSHYDYYYVSLHHIYYLVEHTAKGRVKYKGRVVSHNLGTPE